MALKIGSSRASIDFKFEVANTGFDVTEMGSDSLDNLVQHDTSVIGKGIAKQYTLGVGTTQDIDLFAGLVDPTNGSAAMVKAASVLIWVSPDAPNGGDVFLRAGPTNGLATWVIRAGGDIWIPAGGHVGFGVPDSKAVVVNSTSRNIRLVQSGASPTLVKIVVFGG